MILMITRMQALLNFTLETAPIQRSFIKLNLKPLLQANNFSDVKILTLDDERLFAPYWMDRVSTVFYLLYLHYYSVIVSSNNWNSFFLSLILDLGMKQPRSCLGKLISWHLSWLRYANSVFRVAYTTDRSTTEFCITIKTKVTFLHWPLYLNIGLAYSNVILRLSTQFWFTIQVIYFIHTI